MQNIRNITKQVSAHIDFIPNRRRFFSFFANLRKHEQLITKFGGMPSFLKQSEWPRSKITGKLMKFVCQILFDEEIFKGGGGKIAYLFITDDENVSNNWDPDGEENAVIIKSIKDFTVTKKLTYKNQGPTLDKEYKAELTFKIEPDFVMDQIGEEWDDQQYDEYFDKVEGNKIGGNPSFITYERAKDFSKWRLLLQLDSRDIPFNINFCNSGIGFLFVNADYTEGKFLWQCD